MNQKERMLAGLPYLAWKDGLKEERIQCRRKLAAYNQLIPDDPSEMERQLKALLGESGKDIYIEPPFRCDYGYNIQVGDNFYANFNLVILDVAPVKIGRNAQIAPNVSLFTAGHPVHPDSRNSGYEYGIPITIGDNCWLGGGVIVMPGVTIGHNCVIGAGSVVTKDIPDNSIAVGNPCRVLRQITEADREYYFKDRKFDVSDYR